MELPWMCTRCGWENWIDLEGLTERPLDKLLTAQGYECRNCGMWEAISYTTPSMREAERKLTRYAPGHHKFAFLLAKLVTKQTGVNKRGEAYGKSEYPNVAVPG